MKLYVSKEHTAEGLALAMSRIQQGEPTNVHVSENILETLEDNGILQNVRKIQFMKTFGEMILECVSAGLTPDEYIIVAQRFFVSFPEEAAKLHHDFGIQSPESLAQGFVHLAKNIEENPELREFIEKGDTPSF